MAHLPLPDGLASALARGLGSAPARAQRVAGSVANQDFLVELGDGRRAFVKIGPPAELAAEAWALRRVAPLGLPVPAVLLVGHEPLPILVLGLVPDDERLTAPVLRSAGAALATVHSVTAAGAGPVEVADETAGGAFATWTDFLSAIVDEATPLIAAGLLDRDQHRAIERTASVIRPSSLMGGQGRLLHGDLKRPHVLAVAGRLTGVIDWGDASVGDPAWDLARASMMGEDEYAALASGYSDADNPSVVALLPIYRLLWNVRALTYEHRAGGDWFDAYRGRIAEELARLHQA